MPTQEEIKAAMERYKFCRIQKLVNPHEFACILADAYIAGHDDTPISFKEAYAICETSDHVDIHLEHGDVVAVTGWYDGCDYNARPVKIKIKTRSQLLALRKGLGDERN